MDRETLDALKEANKQSRALEPDAAGEEINEEVVPEVDVEPEEANEAEGENIDETEEESHAEKTKRGRERAEKLRKSEADNERLATDLSEAKLQLAKLEGKMEERDRQGPVVVPPEEPFDPDETLTRGELKEELAKEKAKLERERELAYDKELAYATKYKELTFSFLDGHEDKDEILSLFRSNDPDDIDKYDSRHTGDPTRDVEINLANAERDILRKKNKELSEQLGGKNPKVREDVTDGSGVGAGAEPDPKPKVEKIDATDPDSRDFSDWLKKTYPKTHEKMEEKYRT